MSPNRPNVAAVDLVAKSQLALIHAALVRPVFPWEVIQQLALLWRTTNAGRYRAAGAEPEDIRASLRMVFRDYVQAVREEDPSEAERLRTTLGPELDV
jgi:hypothetical protein